MNLAITRYGNNKLSNCCKIIRLWTLSWVGILSAIMYSPCSIIEANAQLWADVFSLRTPRLSCVITTAPWTLIIYRNMTSSSPTICTSELLFLCCVYHLHCSLEFMNYRPAPQFKVLLLYQLTNVSNNECKTEPFRPNLWLNPCQRVKKLIKEELLESDARL